jgi:hypothetical protein
MKSPKSLEEFLITKHLPAFARRVLVVGCAKEELGRLLRERGVPEIHAIEPDPRLAANVRAQFDSVIETSLPSDELPFPNGYFDCIAFPEASRFLDGLCETLSSLSPLLAPQGYVLIDTRNKQHWRGGDTGSQPEEMGACVESAGLVLYGVLKALDPECGMIQPDPDGNMSLGGNTYHVSSESERLSLVVTDYLFLAVRAGYDPLSHAGAVFDAGHPDWAFEILSMIPAPYLEDDDACANVFGDMMLCQLAMDKGSVSWEERLARFATAQEAFYRAVARKPRLHLLYQCQAQLWRRVGNDDMAARLLRSILHVAPDEETARQLSQCESESVRQIGQIRRIGQIGPIEESGPVSLARPPRILFITHPRPHYGLDVLYDGLCTLLSASNVTEFPWKPSLHGQPPTEMAHYPCVFNRPGRPVEIDRLIARLEQGHFDLILFGDLEKKLERNAARSIINAAGKTPLVIVDEQDDTKDSRREVMEFLGVESVAGFFKREMLECADYGPDAYPLPFAYPDRRVPELADGPRNTPIFWAGHREFGLRRLYLEHIESALGLKLDTVYDQAEYVRALLDTVIGLNIFGCGFDTVRYWELPAHGCMLLAERLPIRIPHNFRDGESAVFFDDTQDLEDKLRYYLAHPDEARAIARAGHEHFKRYHTGSMRARQLLERLGECDLAKRGVFDWHG